MAHASVLYAGLVGFEADRWEQPPVSRNPIRITAVELRYIAVKKKLRYVSAFTHKEIASAM